MNVAIISGNLTRPVDYKTVKSNGEARAVAKGTIAVNRRTKDGKTADFVDVVFWGKLADVARDYTDKGSRIAVHGRIATRSYEDQNGTRRKAFEVIASSLELPPKGNGSAEAENRAADDEEVPF